MTIGQTLKDYFIPKDNKNLSKYYWGDSTSLMKVQIWDKLISDSVYKIEKVIYFKESITNVIRRTVTITRNNIKVTNESYINNFLVDKGAKEYNPPEIWLIMPVKGRDTSWYYTSTNATTKCTAEFTTVTINGISKKAIKVTEQPFEDGQLLDFGILNEYYVQGIGLWKSTTKDGTDFQVLRKQEFDPSLYYTK